ncbi:CZB domain-containing protein [Thioflexithrix psekupsensis]|uniref:Chemoreceptor zinc-binding domain-containing protein n=1 Tax=Thioflexithrix psekupsensis TaxID=1570016 RepID=A0A251X8H9_9GAMM|nr:CZB domain-containing protein [Thioflexithrix psekupsensis]OUD13983.1 hypothetical protein TPSD3_06460 [Thioflexithrix psekupsensis]
MPTKAFFVLRLNDHILYLKKIEKTLAGTGDFQGTDCQNCKLGQWLYGEGPAEVASMNHPEAQALFDSLFEPHKQFHQVSHEAIAKAKAGDTDGARAAATQMYVLSNTISQKLLALDKF